MALSKLAIEGIGMTSQRTRDRMILRLREQGIQHEALLAVMRKVPRHLFMDQALATRSYEDTALPIGHGQTISQPYIVARMTELLLASEQPLEKVLEVGTGSGYQAAILGKLIPKIYTVERIPALHKQARQLLEELGYRNIRTSLSDGSWGVSYEASFDGILVTAAPEEIPKALLEQLAIGARLIIPTGKQGEAQLLKVVTRISETDYQEQVIASVQFVPLIRNERLLLGK